MHEFTAKSQISYRIFLLYVNALLFSSVQPEDGY